MGIRAKRALSYRYSVGMADIQYNESEFARPNPIAVKRSWLAGLVIKFGLAKDDAGAQKALIVVLIVVVIAIVLILILGGDSEALPPAA